MKKRITSFFLVFIIIVGSLLSPAACFADGAGGGYGEIGGGSGTGSYKYRNSRAYVYYDEGGWNDSTTPGSGTAAHQPQMPRGGDITDAHLEWWINKMEEQMENLQKADGTYVGPISYLPDSSNSIGSSKWGPVKEVIRTAMKQACDRALESDPQGENARIVGAAWEYINPGSAKKIAYDLWWFAPLYGSIGPNDFNTLFGGSTSNPRYPNEDNLSAAFGWSTKVDVNNDGNYSETEDWRHFAYDLAAKNQPASNPNVARIYFIAVTDNQPVPSKGFLRLKKSSSDPSITDGNPCYSLKGATYQIYDNAKLSGTPVATLTVADEAGNTNTVKIPNGTYYFKETTAGKGYRLKSFDPSTDKIEISGSNTETDPAVIYTSDVPLNDPLSITISKENGTGVTNPKSLAGTQFTIKYYAVDAANTYNAGQLAAMTPARTWVIETKQEIINQNIFYTTALNASHLVSGSDALFLMDGQPTLPVGYFTIQETKAADGYILNSGNTKIGTQTIATRNEVIVGKVGLDGIITPAYLNASNTASVTNQPQVGGFTLKKYDAATSSQVSSTDTVEFDLYNTNTYNVKVGNTEYAAGAKIGSYSFAANAEYSSGLVLPVGSYKVVETKAPKGYKTSEQSLSIPANNEVTQVSLTDARDTKNVQVTKKSEDLSVADVQFKLSGTNLFGESVTLYAETNENGIATFENVPYSNASGYALEEVSTASRYLTVDPQTVVIDGSSPEITNKEFTNSLVRGSVEITKFDAKTEKPVATEGEITVELYNRNEYPVKVSGTEYAKDGKIGTYTFKTTEKLSVSDLPYGNYEFIETAAPNGYTLTGSTTNRTFAITSAEKLELNVLATGLVDARDTRTVNVQKESEDLVIEGLKFILAGRSMFGDAVYMEATTNAQGIAAFEGVEYSNESGYTITEVETPDRYEPVNSQNVKVTKDSANPITVSFKNVLDRGGFKVAKFDAVTQSAITSGEFEFDLYNRNDYPVVINGVSTPKDGKIASFKSVNGFFQSDKDYIPIGSYELIETKAPYGWEVEGTTSIKFDIVEKSAMHSLDTVSKGFVDERSKGTVVVNKKAEDLKVSGLKFKLTGTSFFGDSVELYAETNTDGVATFNNVPITAEGTSYILEEVDTPERYLEVASQNVEVKAKETTTKEFTNTLVRGSVELQKFDAKTKKQINIDGKVTAELYNRNDYPVKVAGTEYAAGAKIGTFTFDVKDTQKVSDLPYGDYEFVETEAPYSFTLEGITSAAFKVSKQDEAVQLKAASVTLTDVRDTREVRLTKQCEDNIVEGLKFKLTGNNIYGETVEIIAATDKDGICDFGKVEFSDEKGYTITEIETPDRYIQPEPMTVVVNKDSRDIIPITCENVLKKAQIKIYKTGLHFTTVTEDEDIYIPVFEEKALEGAKFEVRANEDITYADGTLLYEKGTVIDTITSNGFGIANSSLLDFGKYEIQEVSVPEGYTLDDTVYTFDLKPTDEDVTVESKDIFNDWQYIKATLEKALETEDVFNTGKNDEIKNVKFGIFAAEDIKAEDEKVIPKDGLVITANADEEGLIVFEGQLPFGKYYAKEVETDEHYILLEDKFPFELKPETADVKTIEIALSEESVENKLILGKVKGKKFTDDGNELAGATIGLFEEGKKEPTLTVVTDKEGYFEFNDIPFGEYIVKETKAPEGYLVDEKEYPVNIDKSEALIDLEIIDKRIKPDVPPSTGDTTGIDEYALITGISFAGLLLAGCMLVCKKRKEID